MTKLDELRVLRKKYSCTCDTCVERGDGRYTTTEPATVKDLIEALTEEGYAVMDMTAWAQFSQ